MDSKRVGERLGQSYTAHAHKQQTETDHATAVTIGRILQTQFHAKRQTETLLLFSAL